MGKLPVTAVANATARDKKSIYRVVSGKALFKKCGPKDKPTLPTWCGRCGLRSRERSSLLEGHLCTLVHILLFQKVAFAWGCFDQASEATQDNGAPIKETHAHCMSVGS